MRESGGGRRIREATSANPTSGGGDRSGHGRRRLRLLDEKVGISSDRNRRWRSHACLTTELIGKASRRVHATRQPLVRRGGAVRELASFGRREPLADHAMAGRAGDEPPSPGSSVDTGRRAAKGALPLDRRAWTTEHGDGWSGGGGGGAERRGRTLRYAEPIISIGERETSSLESISDSGCHYLRRVCSRPRECRHHQPVPERCLRLPPLGWLTGLPPARWGGRRLRCR